MSELLGYRKLNFVFAKLPKGYTEVKLLWYNVVNHCFRKGKNLSSEANTKRQRDRKDVSERQHAKIVGLQKSFPYQQIVANQ